MNKSLSVCFAKSRHAFFVTRCFTSASPPVSGETRIREILQRELNPSHLKVTDVSGGCGSMFDIVVESPSFKGKSMVAQHKLVHQHIKKEIKEMHGLTLKTKAC